MISGQIIRTSILALTIFTVFAFASDSKYDDKLFNEGNNEGAAIAIASLIYNTYGDKISPDPVETYLKLPGKSETLKERLIIHECVLRHVKRDLKKAGGVAKIGYIYINEIFRRVLAYCGVESIKLP
jgi:hypothetical protein